MPHLIVALDYAELMRLPAANRQDVFSRLTPENKSALTRTHAEQWLALHQRELTAEQIAVIQEAIAFLSSTLYRDAADVSSRRREDQLKAKLECALGRKRVTEAFTFVGRVLNPVGARGSSARSFIRTPVHRNADYADHAD